MTTTLVFVTYQYFFVVVVVNKLWRILRHILLINRQWCIVQRIHDENTRININLQTTSNPQFTKLCSKRTQMLFKNKITEFIEVQHMIIVNVWTRSFLFSLRHCTHSSSVSFLITWPIRNYTNKVRIHLLIYTL